MEAARKVTVPVEYVVPWDDEHVDRASGSAPFDEFGSAENTFACNCG